LPDFTGTFDTIIEQCFFYFGCLRQTRSGVDHKGQTQARANNKCGGNAAVREEGIRPLARFKHESFFIFRLPPTQEQSWFTVPNFEKDLDVVLDAMNPTADRAPFPALSGRSAPFPQQAALFGGLFRFLRVSGDFALGLRIALLQVGFEHAQPGAELFEVPFGVLDGQTLGGTVPDHALLRVDVRLELFYFGDQLRFDLLHPGQLDLLHAGQQPDAGTVPSLDTLSARISTSIRSDRRRPYGSRNYAT
jgi:hypothetical protein